MSSIAATEGALRNSPRELPRFLAVGLYAWIVSIFFGAVLLDIAYAGLLSGSAGSSTLAPVFSEVSDLLLGIGFLTLLSGLGAIIFSGKSVGARIFFIGSLAVLAAEFLAPAFLSAVALDAGYLIRIAFNATASVLAFAGVYESCRQR